MPKNILTVHHITLVLQLWAVPNYFVLPTIYRENIQNVQFLTSQFNTLHGKFNAQLKTGFNFKYN